MSNSAEIMDYSEIFQEEAGELLEELETGLLELESDPENLDLVGRIFRAMHTIKGSGAMFGFDDIASFTHHVESALDQVRDGRVKVTHELIDLILAARDHITSLMAAVAGGEPPDPASGDGIVAGLGHLVAGGETPPADDPPGGKDVPPQSGGGGMVHYRVSVRPGPEFFVHGGGVEDVVAGLEKLGDCTVLIHQDADDKTGDQWEILLTTDRGENAVRDELIFIESAAEVGVAELAREDGPDFCEHKRLGEILVARGEVDREQLRVALAAQKPLGELLVDAGLVAPTRVKAALAEQQLLNRSAAKAHKAVDSIRVASDKLDRLINLVGELVVTQARLSDVAAQTGAAALLEPVEGIELLTAELRDCVLNIRMLPIGTSFARFRRLVRDLSAELGKEIALETAGAETELDKNVIDQLADPLVHLIRNSIDHGLEPPDERLAAGKSARGTIRLAARHAGGNVVITVTDDGRGLDVDAIRDQAVARGILRADDDLVEHDILNSIFVPGLSTAREVTSVSGRGVGMDVVKSTIEGLKGTVEVSRSVAGQGMTVSIILPLTLAIIDGLLVRADETSFVVPLSEVEECVELGPEEIERFHGRQVISVRDQLVPYVRLRDFFELPGERPEIEQIVIVEVDGIRSGLVLDDVIGDHQTVIKSLGWAYRNAEGLSGATILGNGEVALILDVPELLSRAIVEEEGTIGCN